MVELNKILIAEELKKLSIFLESSVGERAAFNCISNSSFVLFFVFYGARK